jgi:hypothetical protein
MAAVIMANRACAAVRAGLDRREGDKRMKPELAEVMTLHASYGYTIDHGNVDGFVALFAPDGVFDINGTQVMKGQDAIQEFAGRSNRSGVHSSGAVLFLEDGTARTPFVFVSNSGRVTSGYYHDTFARSGSGALVFSRRDIKFSPMKD